MYFFLKTVLTLGKVKVRLKHKQKRRNEMTNLEYCSVEKLEEMLRECEDDELYEEILEALKNARESEEHYALESRDYYASRF